MMNLFTRRVHFVTGKGGVGKTTIAVALSLIAARAHKRVLLIEIEPGGRVGGLLGSPKPPTYEASLSPAGVSVLAIDGRACLEEYLRLIIPVRRLLAAVFQSKVYQYFVAAAPGLKELMAVGKVWYETERKEGGDRPHWDVIVVDAPATGHSLQYLRMPVAAREAFGPGLVRQEAARVAEMLRDPGMTAIHLVTTAEEMPVTETIEAHEHLTRVLRLPAGMLLVNRVHGRAAGEALVARLREGAGALEPVERALAREVARRAAEEQAWAEINHWQLERLRAGVPLPALVLPEIVTEEFSAADVRLLSKIMEARWRESDGSAGPGLPARGECGC